MCVEVSGSARVFVFDPILTKIGEIVVLMSTIKKSRTFVPFRLNVEE